jgi:hypothetical protein
MPSVISPFPLLMFQIRRREPVPAALNIPSFMNRHIISMIPALIEVRSQLFSLSDSQIPHKKRLSISSLLLKSIHALYFVLKDSQIVASDILFAVNTHTLL